MGRPVRPAACSCDTCISYAGASSSSSSAVTSAGALDRGEGNTRQPHAVDTEDVHTQDVGTAASLDDPIALTRPVTRHDDATEATHVPSLTSISRAAVSSSRTARRSRVFAALDLSDNFVLPPRLGTPIPSFNNSLPQPTSAITAEGADEDASLTTIGRRALNRINDTRSIRSRLEELDAQISMASISRAQSALQGSRFALVQARDAIRNALAHSERLERIATVLRRQILAAPPSDPPELSPSTRSELAALSEARSGLSLERALADLRAASVEIDRVITLSRPTAALRDLGDSLVSTPNTLEQHEAARIINDASSMAGVTSPHRYAYSSLNRGVPAAAVPELDSAIRADTAMLTPPESSYNPRLQQSTGRIRMSSTRVTLPSRNVGELLPNPPMVRIRPSQNDESVAEISSSPRAFSRAEVAVSPPPAERQLRRLTRGGWRRLDANGDEIESDSDAGGNVPASTSLDVNRGFGWRWFPASSPPASAGEEDKPSHRAPLSLDWTYSGDSDGARLAPTSARPQFNGDREMVGR